MFPCRLGVGRVTFGESGLTLVCGDGPVLSRVPCALASPTRHATIVAAAIPKKLARIGL